MSFELDLVNFQSIGKATLVFETGINLIVGQSNSGKTAILRAIATLLSNPSKAKLYIKQGTNQAIVTATYDGNEMIWSRNQKGGAKYEINGEVYEKIGYNNMFDILKNNGFVLDDSGNIMNIEGEWNLPFPFDRNSAELFKLFENIFCVSNSAVILKSFKEDEARLVKNKSEAEDRKNRLQSKLKALSELEAEVNIPQIEADIIRYEKDSRTYFDMISDMDNIQKCSAIAHFNIDEVKAPTEYSITEYHNIYNDLRFLENVIARNKFYKTLPDIMEVPNTIHDYIESSADYTYIEQAKKLQELDLSRDFVVSEDITHQYLDMCEDYKTLEKAQHTVKLMEELSDEDKEVPETIDFYVELTEDMKQIQLLKQASELDLSKEAPNVEGTLDNYLSMVADYEDIVNCFKNCKAIKSRYDSVSLQLKQLTEQLNSYQICPLCGHALNEED